MRNLLCLLALTSLLGSSSIAFGQADSTAPTGRNSPFWISTGRSYLGVDLGLTGSDYLGSKNFLWGITTSPFLSTYLPFNNLGTGVGFVGGIKGGLAISSIFDVELKARFMMNHTSNTETNSAIQLDPYVPTAVAAATSSYSLTLSSLDGALLGHIRLNDWLYGALGGSAATYTKNGFSGSQLINGYYVNQVNHSYTAIAEQQTGEEQINNWFFGYRFDAQVGAGSVYRIGARNDMLLDVELLFSIPLAQWLTKEADSSLNATASRWLQPSITDPHLWYMTLTVGLRLPFHDLPPVPPPPVEPKITEQSIKIEPVPLHTKEGIMLTGRVTDAQTGRPLIAEMTTVDLSNNMTLGKTTTDSNGNFSVPVSGIGKFSITADVPGYLFGTALFQVDSQGRVLKDPEDLKLSPISGGKTRLLVFFEFDKSDLQPASLPELNRAVAMMKNVPALKIEIAGYTDSVGTRSHNMDLSLRRATAVRDYMVQQGILESRITAKGYGPDSPIETNSTDEGRAQNRRVEFVVKER